VFLSKSESKKAQSGGKNGNRVITAARGYELNWCSNVVLSFFLFARDSVILYENLYGTIKQLKLGRECLGSSLPATSLQNQSVTPSTWQLYSVHLLAIWFFY
jgi:hypothetical protein